MLFTLNILEHLSRQTSVSSKMYTPQVPRLRVLPELAARKPSDVNVMVLYFSWHGMKPETIQKLVYMKLSWSVKEDCVQAWHDFVVDGTKRDFAEQTPPWDWSEIKLGRYIGQGWTDLREFLYVTELTEEDCQKTAGVGDHPTYANSS